MDQVKVDSVEVAFMQLEVLPFSCHTGEFIISHIGQVAIVFNTGCKEWNWLPVVEYSS